MRRMLLILCMAACSWANAASVASAPAMRPDKHWWALARHAEILKRLENAKTNVYDLVLVGDSITHRWERSDCGGKVYPKLTNRYRVLNLGDGGDRTQHVLWRLDHGALGQDYPYTARVFAVMIGVNNGTDDPEGTVEGVKAIVGRIAKAHPESRIILMPILPCGRKPLADARQTVVNPALQRFAAEKGLTWLDFTAAFLDASGELKPGLMMKDNLHPVANGYEIWLDALCPVVDKLLERK